jgi:hypothetical protein
LGRSEAFEVRLKDVRVGVGKLREEVLKPEWPPRGQGVENPAASAFIPHQAAVPEAPEVPRDFGLAFA